MGAYDEQWKRYRRLRRHVWIAFAGFALSGLTAVFANLPPRVDWIKSVLVGAFWLCFFVAVIPYKRFRCPRCGEDFERRWPNKKHPDRNTCPHCGLEKFSDGVMQSTASTAQTPASS
jgi:DNA-directed RNA polymerase subunit RPC12/RpoP